MHKLGRLPLRIITYLASLLGAFLLVAKVTVGNMGNVQALSAAGGTFGQFVGLINALPTWLLAAVVLIATGSLAWSLISDARDVERMRKDFKAVNDRAWNFEPRFDAAMVKLEETITVLKEQIELEKRERDTMLQNSDRVFQEYTESKQEAFKNSLQVGSLNATVGDILRKLDRSDNFTQSYAKACFDDLKKDVADLRQSLQDIESKIQR